MSQTNRWYTFGRKTPQDTVEIRAIEPGTVYEVWGWSRTEDAALAKRDKLDRAGRAGINIFAPSLQQAIADIMEVFDGVVVDGYISPANKRAGRQLVKAAVMRAIFCPYTGVVLDMRRAVVVETRSSRFVMAATHWDALSASAQDVVRNQDGTTVYDGRELFKR